MKGISLINACNSFSELNRLTENIRTGITFWGWRYVSITVLDRCYRLPIASITVQKNRILALNPNFSAEERVCLRALENKMHAIYAESERLYERSRCITQLFCRIRNWFSRHREIVRHPYRGDGMERGAASEFYYSDAQFLAEYGISIENARKWCGGFESRGGFGPQGWRLNRNHDGSSNSLKITHIRYERPAIML